MALKLKTKHILTGYIGEEDKLEELFYVCDYLPKAIYRMSGNIYVKKQKVFKFPQTKKIRLTLEVVSENLKK